MNPQMRLVIMLAVLWAGGSILFAAETTTPRGAQPSASESGPSVAAEQAQTKPEGEDPEEGAPEETDKAKTEKAEDTAGEQADGKVASDAVPEEGKDPESKRAPTTADRARSPQRFTPSEQVRADFDVSFPIDI